jgi:hypothetical protein
MDYRPFRAPTAWKLWTSVPGLEKALEGRVLYATKPRNTSFGLGLLARRRFGVPLALDVDDWEMAFLFESIYWEIRTHGLGWLREPLSPLYTPFSIGWCEALMDGKPLPAPARPREILAAPPATPESGERHATAPRKTPASPAS